jgi:hypothetical protein
MATIIADHCAISYCQNLCLKTHITGHNAPFSLCRTLFICSQKVNFQTLAPVVSSCKNEEIQAAAAGSVKGLHVKVK